MEQVIDQPEVRPEIVEAMRDLASQGMGVRELVKCIQLRLGLEDGTLLPVLWYFMKAFHLSLGDVLPIREWLGTANDKEIDALLLPAIKRARAKWST
jgi:hypothetical protein